HGAQLREAASPKLAHPALRQRGGGGEHGGLCRLAPGFRHQRRGPPGRWRCGARDRLTPDDGIGARNGILAGPVFDPWLTARRGAVEDGRRMNESPASDTIYESVDQVKSPLILEMLAYWRSKAVGERLPRPAAIDPTEIPRLIASIVICELETDPFRVRFRLAGTKQVHILGNELTGRSVDEMNWGEGPFVHRIFARARDTAAPVFGFYYWGFRENTPGASEFGLFPLSEDGRSVTRVIGIDEFFPEPGSPAFRG